jgi:hypothetical protein
MEEFSILSLPSSARMSFLVHEKEKKDDYKGGRASVFG